MSSASNVPTAMRNCPIKSSFWTTKPENPLRNITSNYGIISPSYRKWRKKT